MRLEESGQDAAWKIPAPNIMYYLLEISIDGSGLCDRDMH
jgi:D-arabinose 1-dehydrogenase-like Zn-dependent alcohol dehydrogenase